MSKVMPPKGQASPTLEGGTMQEASYLEKGKETSKEEGDKVLRYTFNTIVRGFIMGWKTSSARKWYACHILNIEDISKEFEEGGSKTPETEIIFSKKDAADIHPHNKYKVVSTVKCNECEVRRVLVDQGSFADILYWNAFERHCLDLGGLKDFKGSLVGFFGERESKRLHHTKDHLRGGRTGQEDQGQVSCYRRPLFL